MRLDYKKLPLYWRYFGKYQKLWCALGLHIPVKIEGESSDDEYICQQCFIPVSQEDWERFFKRARRKGL